MRHISTMLPAPRSPKPNHSIAKLALSHLPTASSLVLFGLCRKMLCRRIPSPGTCQQGHSPLASPLWPARSSSPARQAA